ncbi:MAG: LPS export ABC transporter periplasmic protein LptC [Thermodesulfovibrio sp.]|nr:LPS export ABC transporter periplasmic protein LptC [Thermodesulfovibrio sp.]
MKKVWFAALALAFFSLYFLIVKDERVTLPSLGQNSVSYIEGIRIVQKNNGKNDWIVTARRAEILGNGNKADLSDIEVKVKDKDLTISAEKGLYDMQVKKLIITGPVTAKDRNYTITSQDVEFDNATGILKTDKKVRMEGTKFTLTGTGMHADNNEQKIRILNNVTATYNN